MNIVITNNLTAPVPVLSSDEGGWCVSAVPATPLTVSRPDTNDCIIGDKPDVTEQILEGLGTAFEAVKKILTLRRPTPQALDADALDFTIGNNGPNAIRVILGNGVDDEEVLPGVEFHALSRRYIEIRELGLAPQQGGTPD